MMISSSLFFLRSRNCTAIRTDAAARIFLSSSSLPLSSSSLADGTCTTLRWKSSSSKDGGSGGGGGGGNKKKSRLASSSSSSSSFRPRRPPTKGGYYYNRHSIAGMKKKKKMTGHGKIPKQKGPKDPYDIKTPIPTIYDTTTTDTTTSIIDPKTLSSEEQQQILNANADYDHDGEDDYDMTNSNDGMRFSFDMDDEDDLTELGTLMGGALRSLRHEQQQQQQQQQQNTTVKNDEIENHMRLMDYFTSESGSTEDLVGTRRAVSMETYTSPTEEDTDADPNNTQLLQKKSEKSQQLLQTIDKFVHHERSEYMDLPTTDLITEQDIQNANSSSNVTNQIPPNQLAHGPWGEMLIRTDRVSKMWRGGRIISFRALVIGGNVRGCGGFGVGKSFEPQDAVEIACRMAKRNIYFVDRYRNRTLTRDLVGRQNSCKVILRTTSNGLRGNPLCCEILKLFGITNVVAKAFGSRNHYNVCRATFKALLTHESLDDIAMKRGVRLINLQQAKRLGI